MTPRSRTAFTLWTTSYVTVSDDVLGRAASFWRLVRDMNQISSVLCGFICSRLDENHQWISATHCCRRSTVCSACAIVVDAITWVSSAYKWYSWDGGCGSAPPVPPYIRWTTEDLIQILGDAVIHTVWTSWLAVYADSLWSLTMVRLAPVQRPGFNGKALV